MAETIYKVLMFLKRRSGLSVEEFREHYETTHAKLSEKYLQPSTVRYVRRFIDPIGGEEVPFDVITELWVNDKGFFDAVSQLLAQQQPPPEILADEEWLFDRKSSRVAAVTESDTDVAAVLKANAASAEAPAVPRRSL